MGNRGEMTRTYRTYIFQLRTACTATFLLSYLQKDIFPEPYIFANKKNLMVRRCLLFFLGGGGSLALFVRCKTLTSQVFFAFAKHRDCAGGKEPPQELL